MTNGCTCHGCLIEAISLAAQSREGHFSQQGVASAAKSLVRTWTNYETALSAARVALTVGCPTCGSPADHWCVSAAGNPYDLAYGAAYVHAARRHAIEDLDHAPDLRLVEDEPSP